MSVELPRQKVKAEVKSPQNLMIFSKPKVGKTSALAELENTLILDLEGGSRYVDALKIEANSVDDIKAIGAKIIGEGRPYNCIAIDTVTRLEEICVDYAEVLYSRTSMGKNWFKQVDGKLASSSGKAIYGNILNLPQGGGYKYLRDAITRVIEYVKTWAPRVILVAHVKDAKLDSKDGKEFEVSDLDLTGKIKRILTSQSDAIGYLYRKGDQNILTFRTSDKVAAGARPKHLENKDIVLSELVDGELITHWDEIFID